MVTAEGRAMSNRSAETTSHIRDTAIRLLVRDGHSNLTMDSLAAGSYVSVGSVYARWPNRTGLFMDLIETCIVPAIDEIARAEDGLRGRLAAAMRPGRTAMAIGALTEIALASTHIEEIQPKINETAVKFVESMSPGANPGISWLLASSVIGWSVLNGGGCGIPDFADELSDLVHSMCSTDLHAVASRQTPVLCEPPVPTSPHVKADDDIARSLVRETTKSLAESGLNGSTTKNIAARAGVTTGAMYRRYTSKMDLVHDSLVRELSPPRYEWTAAFLSAFAGNSEQSPGEILSQQVLRLVSDRYRSVSDLQIIHAARLDDHLRSTLNTQLHSAAKARSTMFGQLRDEGVVSTTMSTELLGWLIQCAPTGARVLSTLGLIPRPDDLRHGMESLISAVTS